MRNERKLSPYTPQQVSAVAQSKLNPRERRLIETIRDRESLVDLERVINNQERADELSQRVAQLEAELATAREDSQRCRVLIVATSDQTLEVYADPGIRLAVANIPDANNDKDRRDAEEWALSKIPHELRAMVNDATIRSELYSSRCLDRIGFRYYRDRMAEYNYLEAVAAAIGDIAEGKE